MSQVLKDRKYTESHEWVKIEGSTANRFDRRAAVVGLGHLVPPARKQRPQHRAVGEVVIHHEHGTFPFDHSETSVAASGLPAGVASPVGRRIVNVVPPFGSLVTRISPPWASTMR